MQTTPSRAERLLPAKWQFCREIPRNSWGPTTRLFTCVPLTNAYPPRISISSRGRYVQGIKKGPWIGCVKAKTPWKPRKRCLTRGSRRIVLLHFNPYELRRQPEKGFRETQTTIHYTTERTTCAYNQSERNSFALSMSLLEGASGAQIDFKTSVVIKGLPSASVSCPSTMTCPVLIRLLCRARQALAYGASEACTPYNLVHSWAV